ncbi:MAG: zinc ribbon domain-containing protein [Actinomycetes bacterium]
MLNASPVDQLRLLDLQAADTRLDQLAHRRRTLPEAKEVAELAAAAETIADEVVVAGTELSDLQQAMAKAETDVDQVRVRAARDQQRLDAGAVGSAKELEALAHEIGSLARRQAELEDVTLEVMERVEEATRRTSAAEAAHRQHGQRLADAAARRDAALAALARDEDVVSGGRAELAAALPGDLLALYDKLRVANVGVGAAALHQGRCEGCRLQLTSSALAQLRSTPADTVCRCEECGRILVRTERSGLLA